jgi:lipopolysaccharide biosynthesis glycosyltransferase
MGWPNQFVYDRLPLAREAGFLQGGLQIYDLKGVRQEHIFKDALQFALDFPEKCETVDQDAMNVALQGRWQVLDWRWNVMGFEARHCPKPFYIRHHGGPKKPWSADKSESELSINASWKRDLLESPWPQKYQRTAFFKTYIRPVSRALEERAKAIIYGAYKEEKRYLRKLPRLLKQVEEFAREGRLATALDFR